VRAPVVDGEELLAHADHADRSTVELDDAAAVAPYLVDGADMVPHATTSSPEPIDLLSMTVTRRAVERNASTKEQA
jgi:hypothetical protein